VDSQQGRTSLCYLLPLKSGGAQAFSADAEMMVVYAVMALHQGHLVVPESAETAAHFLLQLSPASS